MKSQHLLTPAILASSLLLSSPALAQNQAQSPAPENFRLTEDFSRALGHLEGATDNLSVTDMQRRIQGWTQIFEGALNSQLTAKLVEEGELPEGLEKIDLSKLLQLFGLDKLDTYALGVEELEASWLQRSFLGINGQAKGLMALGGTENHPWQATQIARKDDDLILEFSLDAEHLGAWLVEALELLNESLPAELGEELAAEGEMMAFLSPEMLAQPMLPNGQSVLELLNDIGQPRISLMLNLPPAEDMPELLYDLYEEKNPNLFFEAGGSLTLAIDQAKSIRELLDPLLAEFETIEQDGQQVTSFLPNDPKMLEMMELPVDMLAQLSYDPESTALVFEYGKASAAAPGSITQSEDFLASTKPLPAEGMGFAWVSKEAIDTLHTVVELIVQESGKVELELAQGLIMPAITELYGLPPQGEKHGVAGAGYWVEGGYLEVMNSPVAPADYSIFGIYLQTMLSELASEAMEDEYDYDQVEAPQADAPQADAPQAEAPEEEANTKKERKKKQKQERKKKKERQKKQNKNKTQPLV